MSYNNLQVGDTVIWKTDNTLTGRVLEIDLHRKDGKSAYSHRAALIKWNTFLGEEGWHNLDDSTDAFFNVKGEDESNSYGRRERY